MHQIKDISYDVSSPLEMNVDKLVIEQPISIVEKIKDEDLDSNLKLL